ncbi:MAG TPA: toll/interleukin-1 receptor domain-containing protein [Candidatus Baltobacteraceae bacterium]|nr:toll/interleukin-1 receptor domain-containing protein [Candidatus Baltobacteraceae bacterium]
MPLQVFISYARDDDLPPLGETTGFVTALYTNLKHEFRLLGPPAPELWRDKRQIEPSDQFDPVIESAVRGSQLFLVVFSRTWPKRPYCLLELEMFVKAWRHEGEAAVRKRIVLVGKHNIDPKDRPAYLQGQEGYIFYARDGEEEPGREEELTGRDYYDAVKRLATGLRLRALEYEKTSGTADPAGGAKPATPAKGGRTIYLAKPAADMRAAYLRLTDELQGRGYNVVPDRDVEIPYDGTAPDFIDSALAQAEVSIHLLGEKAGYAPEDSDPIVKLQLARAAHRTETETAKPAEQAFRRIIWAPKVLVGQDGQAQTDAERDPLAVLLKSGEQLPGDKVDGSEISKFVDFITQHLIGTAPSATNLDSLASNAQVYVYHRPEDTDYAVDFAKALQKRQIEPVFPAFDGDPVELTAWHREKLRECDAVVVCWANAAEVWARSRFPEFRDWHELGREKKFACRALVAGPPPGQRKLVLVELPPRNEIDVVLDLTADEKPTPESLDPLINAARSASA